MLTFSLSVCVCILCFVAALRRARAMKRAVEYSRTISQVVRELRQRAPDVRARAALAHEWLSEILTCSSHELAVSLLNEQLSEVQRGARVGAEIPRAAARIAITSATALAIFEILPAPGDMARVLWAGGGFATGLLTAVIVSQLGRVAQAHTREHIQTWNGLVRAVSGLLPPEAPRTGDGQEPSISS